MEKLFNRNHVDDWHDYDSCRLNQILFAYTNNPLKPQIITLLYDESRVYPWISASCTHCYHTS